MDQHSTQPGESQDRQQDEDGPGHSPANTQHTVYFLFVKYIHKYRQKDEAE